MGWKIIQKILKYFPKHTIETKIYLPIPLFLCFKILLRKINALKNEYFYWKKFFLLFLNKNGTKIFEWKSGTKKSEKYFSKKKKKKIYRSIFWIKKIFILHWKKMFYFFFLRKSMFLKMSISAGKWIFCFWTKMKNIFGSKYG